jgi:hypothetical protein
LSRLASSRGSSASAASSRSAASGQRRPGGVLVQSPKSDIYVAILGVSLAAILFGCILLALAWSKYGFSTKVTSNANAAQTTSIV